MKKWTYFLPATIFYLLIFLLSSRDIQIDFGSGSLDKVAHILEFGLLGYLLAIGFFNAFALPTFLKSALTFGSGLILGIFDEVHQLSVPGRSGDLKDILADAAGLILGILVFRYLAGRRKPAAKSLR
jgi:VanZ family protein